MPWHVVPNHSSCPASKPFGVVKNADGSLAGCHPSKAAANKQLAALYANEGMMHDNEPNNAFERVAQFNITEARGDGLTLEGYAAVFNSPTLIHDWLGEYEEVIAPGAFEMTIRSKRPVLMFNHGKDWLGKNMPIGSIQSLREDVHGLFVQARMFDNWLTQPILQAISSDPPAIDGMSFRFSVPDGKDSWDRTRQPELRTVHEVKLYELGPVVFPAYEDTTVALRSLAAHVPGLVLSFNTQTEEVVGTPDEPAERSSEEAAEGPDPVDQSGDDTKERRLARHAQRTSGFVAHLERIKEPN